MLLDLWFHHANPPRMGVFHGPRKAIERRKENDEALLLVGLI